MAIKTEKAVRSKILSDRKGKNFKKSIMGLCVIEILE